jgi:hypothetical protein
MNSFASQVRAAEKQKNGGRGPPSYKFHPYGVFRCCGSDHCGNHCANFPQKSHLFMPHHGQLSAGEAIDMRAESNTLAHSIYARVGPG